MFLIALLLGAPAFGSERAGDVTSVVVKDPYLELHTGPGRGYPVAQVIDRGESVNLLRRRTDWIKVRNDRGIEGWVNRSQLERTLTPDGESVKVPGPSPEGRLEHRWETSIGTGDFDGASMITASGSFALTHSMIVRADVSQLLGNFSNGWLVTAGIAHIFVPEWRVSPFVGIGGGMIHLQPESTLVQSQDRTDPTAYAGLGVRGFLTDRFLLQAEYRKYQVFTSRDENEEPAAWSVAFTYFF
jgi:SH3 domain-containing protein